MRPFTKPAIPVADQLTLLKARGLHIRDEARAARFLEAVSFFRLTPYMRPFQLANSPNHDFLPDTGFRQLSQLYDFDRRLRLLVIDAIERVEVAARAAISNHMGSAHGAHWYLQRNLFKNHYDHARLLWPGSSYAAIGTGHAQGGNRGVIACANAIEDLANKGIDLRDVRGVSLKISGYRASLDEFSDAMEYLESLVAEDGRIVPAVYWQDVAADESLSVSLLVSGLTRDGVAFMVGRSARVGRKTS